MRKLLFPVLLAAAAGIALAGCHQTPASPPPATVTNRTAVDRTGRNRATWSHPMPTGAGR